MALRLKLRWVALVRLGAVGVAWLWWLSVNQDTETYDDTEWTSELDLVGSHERIA